MQIGGLKMMNVGQHLPVLRKNSRKRTERFEIKEKQMTNINPFRHCFAMFAMTLLAIVAMNGQSRAANPVPVSTDAMAVFAGGCFWCMESEFSHHKGISDVTSGYAGGEGPAPTYEQVSSGSTGFKEAIAVTYRAYKDMDPVEAAAKVTLAEGKDAAAIAQPNYVVWIGGGIAVLLAIGFFLFKILWSKPVDSGATAPAFVAPREASPFAVACETAMRVPCDDGNPTSSRPAPARKLPSPVAAFAPSISAAA